MSGQPSPGGMTIVPAISFALGDFEHKGHLAVVRGPAGEEGLYFLVVHMDVRSRSGARMVPRSFGLAIFVGAAAIYGFWEYGPVGLVMALPVGLFTWWIGTAHDALFAAVKPKGWPWLTKAEIHERLDGFFASTEEATAELDGVHCLFVTKPAVRDISFSGLSASFRVDDIAFERVYFTDANAAEALLRDRGYPCSTRA